MNQPFPVENADIPTYAPASESRNAGFSKIPKPGRQVETAVYSRKRGSNVSNPVYDKRRLSNE